MPLAERSGGVLNIDIFSAFVIIFVIACSFALPALYFSIVCLLSVHSMKMLGPREVELVGGRLTLRLPVSQVDLPPPSLSLHSNNVLLDNPHRVAIQRPDL